MPLATCPIRRIGAKRVNSRPIGQKSGEICTGQADLQQILFKPGRLLGFIATQF